MTAMKLNSELLAAFFPPFFFCRFAKLRSYFAHLICPRHVAMVTVRGNVELSLSFFNGVTPT